MSFPAYWPWTGIRLTQRASIGLGIRFGDQTVHFLGMLLEILIGYRHFASRALMFRVWEKLRFGSYAASRTPPPNGYSVRKFQPPARNPCKLSA